MKLSRKCLRNMIKFANPYYLTFNLSYNQPLGLFAICSGKSNSLGNLSALGVTPCPQVFFFPNIAKFTTTDQGVERFYQSNCSNTHYEWFSQFLGYTYWRTIHHNISHAKQLTNHNLWEYLPSLICSHWRFSASQFLRRTFCRSNRADIHCMEARCRFQGSLRRYPSLQQYIAAIVSAFWWCPTFTEFYL